MGTLLAEVTGMLSEMELLQYIYKTADMGCQGIDTVEEHAEKRLREELRRERREYQNIRDEADDHIRQMGDTPAGVGTMARVSAEWMSKGQLAMDDSCIGRMDEQGPARHGRFAGKNRGDDD